MSILVKGGTVVTPKKSFLADLRMEHGKITEIGENLPQEASLLYSAKDCLLFPGFIDAHTHLDMSTATATTADDFQTGTRAALVGGTTTIVDFATQEKGETLKQALANWHKKAKGRASCNYAFHMAITDWNENVCQEMDEMVQAGVTSFKLYLAYNNLRVTDAQLYEVLCRVRQLHGMVGVHCENGDLVNELVAARRAAGELSPAAHPASRPDYVEAEAISRYLYLAKAANVPVNVVHISTALGLQEVRKARAQGQTVYVETCPQYLVLEESRYALPGFEGAKYVCSPPLRRAEDADALWQALQNGEIDTVSTDHCSFCFHGQKEQGLDDFSKIPNGLPGIEHRPALFYSYGVCKNRVSKEQMAAQLSEHAARLFGMYPQKGVLAVGSDADVVVWEPSRKHILSAGHMEQNVDYTPYENMLVKGSAQTVFLNGEPVVENGEITAEHRGAYIHRHASEYFQQETGTNSAEKQSSI